MFRIILKTAICLLAAACGESPEELGVRINTVALSKTDVGATPADLPHRVVESWQTAKADLLGDDEEEVITKLEKGVQIRSSDGLVISEIKTDDYLTDFGAITASRPDKKDLVLYTYPNRHQGGTFQVITPDEVTVASWDESPPPSQFTTDLWHGTPALFYLRSDELIVRSPRGDLLAKLPAPSGVAFQQVYVGHTREHVVLVASGNGYTPFHMVAAFDAHGRLVYHEVAAEHAMGLEVTESAFDVLTRSREWRYSFPSAAR